MTASITGNHESQCCRVAGLQPSRLKYGEVGFKLPSFSRQRGRSRNGHAVSREKLLAYQLLATIWGAGLVNSTFAFTLSIFASCAFTRSLTAASAASSL